MPADTVANILSESTLIPVTGVLALLGCTWKISAMITKGIEATNGLQKAVRSLSDHMNSHVLESDNRDKQNMIEHSMIRSNLDATVEGLRSTNHRLTRVETQSDKSDIALADLNTRVSVIESR